MGFKKHNSLRIALHRRLQHVWPWYVHAKACCRYGMTYPRSLMTASRRLSALPPISVDREGALEVHMLVCHRDWKAAAWAAYSWYYHSERRDPFYLHDDGTLGPEQKEVFERIFPGVHYVERASADREMAQVLDPVKHPACREFRRTEIMGVKLFDAWHMGASPYILNLDSDVLFFKRPDTLLRYLSAIHGGERMNNLFLQDAIASYSYYSVSPERIREAFDVSMPKTFNAGMGFIDRQAMDLDTVERFLVAFSERDGYSAFMEQTVWAFLSARHGLELLDPSQYLVLQRAAEDKLEGVVACHYAGAARASFYTHGVPLFLAGGP